MDKHKRRTRLCDSWLVRRSILWFRAHLLDWEEALYSLWLCLYWIYLNILKCFSLVTHAGRFSQVNWLLFWQDCCFGTLAVTVKFVFEHTSSIKKRLCTPSDWVYSDYVQVVSFFCFLNVTLADLVEAVDCFGKLAVTVALPLAVFEFISITL